MTQPAIRQRARATNLEPSPAEIQAEMAAVAAAANDEAQDEGQVDDAPEEAQYEQPLVVHEGTILVKRVAYGVAEENLDVIQVPMFHTAPARVRVGATATRNLSDGNYAKVEVMVEVPAYPVDCEIHRAYDYATSLCDEFVPVELVKAGVPVDQPLDQEFEHELGQVHHG